MKKRISIIIAMVLTANVSINAQVNNNTNDYNKPDITGINVEIADKPAVILDGKRITLSEAIAAALENNPDLYISMYEAAMSDTDYMKYNAKYSPFLNVEGKTSSQTNPELFYQKSGKETDTTSLTASLAKSFSTGTTVTAGVSDTYMKMNTGFGPKYSMNIPVMFAGIEQELLKNMFGNNNRRQERILKNVTEMKKDARIYSMSMISLVVIADYWNVVITQNQVENSKLLLEETKKVKRIVTDKVKIGLSEPFEMNNWDSLVAISKTKLSQAEQNYRNALRKFYSDINSDNEIKMQARVVLTDKLPVLNLDDSIKRAMSKRADYLNAIRSLENAKLALEINENSALPSLKGSVTASISKYDIKSSDLNPSYSENTNVRNYEAKLSLSYPLKDTNQETEERNAGYGIQQAKKKLEATARSVKDDVITKMETINTRHEIYGNAKEASRQAYLYYKNMLENLSRGRFNAATVKDALERLVNCHESELNLLVAFNISLIEFDIARNELFEKYNIDVKKFINLFEK